ncbi:MAG: UpxY family transcription antiterminator [Balneolales bacterium]
MELRTEDASWRAFYVKPRHEKKVSERLEADGIEVYCPLITTKVRWSDRWKKVSKPLIRGYVFARVTEKERRESVEDPGILRTVFWKGKPALIRDEEIEVMRHFLDEAEEVNVSKLQPGDRVKVTEGGRTLGIDGMEGVVAQVKGGKVSIQIESLQIQLSVTVPQQMLSKLERSKPSEF